MGIERCGDRLGGEEEGERCKRVELYVSPVQLLNKANVPGHPTRDAGRKSYIYMHVYPACLVLTTSLTLPLLYAFGDRPDVNQHLG